MVNRREIMATIGTVGTVSIAGCSSVLESEEYEQGDKESLLPDEVGEDWPDQDLEPNHDINDDYERVWTTPDENLAIMMGVNIYDSVSTAEDAFEKAEATAKEAKDYPMADEAYISDDGETATCVFRHSNALGEILAARRSGSEFQPDRARATEYAEHLFQYWQ